ncbi:MAG TPA: GTPase HflX, partial [Clostridiales bacterium]|nr:GTPase HflX [Clostridiales bacterium]
MAEIENCSAVLVGMAERSSDLPAVESSLDELARLLDTAGGHVYARVIQVKSTFDPRTCIGSGKVAEIAALCRAGGVALVVFDFELSPAQIRNLEEEIGDDVSVIDRSMLILDIFALHATSGEGKLQVELAQLKYSAPRLTGKGASLSRQGGGIGSRGPGESKLETDRRHLKERIRALEGELAEMERNRLVMRRQRDRSGLPKIAIVGYTNAGKSTLLNALTDAGVLSEDKLFATLDPTTRKLTLPSGENVLLTDTVGFIRKLPHHLVEAFKSTLDEVRYSDILMIVSDISDPEVEEHLRVTEAVADELGAKDKPRLYVYNKCDRIEGLSHAAPTENTVAVSAKEGRGLYLLLSAIETILHAGKTDCHLLLPYTEQGRLSDLYRDYAVLSVDYEEDGIRVTVRLDEKGRG